MKRQNPPVQSFIEKDGTYYEPVCLKSLFEHHIEITVVVSEIWNLGQLLFIADYKNVSFWTTYRKSGYSFVDLQDTLKKRVNIFCVTYAFAVEKLSVENIQYYLLLCKIVFRGLFGGVCQIVQFHTQIVFNIFILHV